MAEVLGSDSFRVQRAVEVESQPPEDNFQGLAGFQQACDSLLDLGEGDQCGRVEFKITGIQQEGSLVTRQLVSLSGTRGGKSYEQHSVWRMVWDRTPEQPQIKRIDVERFEEVERVDAAGPIFRDDTATVLGNNECYERQLVPGVNDWLGRIDSRINNGLFGHQGLALGDVNGDGLDDLYLCQPGGMPNRLLIHQPDGSAVDASSSAGVDWNDHTRGALLVDLDNDGDQDLGRAYRRVFADDVE